MERKIEVNCKRSNFKAKERGETQDGLPVEAQKGGLADQDTKDAASGEDVQDDTKVVEKDWRGNAKQC